MKILEVASNNQVVQAIKTINELTESERKAVNLEDGTLLTDYTEFWVHYSKTGQLGRVQTRKLKAKKNS